MADDSHRSWTTAYIVLPLLFVVAVASLLPLIETNVWWIRYFDYLRIQFTVALVVLLLLHLALRPTGVLGWAGLAIAVAGLGYNLYRIHPYMGIMSEPAIAVSACPDTSSMRILTANVQKRNETADEFIRLVRRIEPDLILIVETDAFWDNKLTVLDNAYPHRVQHIPDDHAYYGMHLFSKYELASPEFRFLFDAFTPTLSTGVRLPDGVVVEFLGLHPRPPQSWSQPTTMRDAHLLAAGLQARESAAPTVMAGDFNAVPWARVTRRTMRIGSLLDPRVGRGYYPTYVLQTFLLSWPLDQILFEDKFALRSFRVLPGIGSDHYPLYAHLCHVPEVADRQQAPRLEPGDLEEAKTSIEAALALAKSGK